MGYKIYTVFNATSPFQSGKNIEYAFRQDFRACPCYCRPFIGDLSSAERRGEEGRSGKEGRLLLAGSMRSAAGEVWAVFAPLTDEFDEPVLHLEKRSTEVGRAGRKPGLFSPTIGDSLTLKNFAGILFLSYLELILVPSKRWE